MKRVLVILAVAAVLAGCAAPTTRVGVASKGRLGAGDSLGLSLQDPGNPGSNAASEFALYPQD